MRTYLDHAATSPVRPEVARQVAEDLTSGLAGWANPSALGCVVFLGLGEFFFP